MDLQTRKIEFVMEFFQIQSEEAIERFEKLLKREQKNSQTDSMSAKELSDRIEKSELDFKENRYKSTSELLAKYE